MSPDRQSYQGEPGGYDEWSDDELVRRARAGDDRAFGHLYERYSRPVGRRLLRVLGRHQDAEDLLQKTFLEVYRTLDRFTPGASFNAWVHAIAFRVTGSHIRSQRRKWWLRSTSDGSTDLFPDASVTPMEANTDNTRAAKRILAAMERLPANNRIAFALHEIEEMGLTEIGKLTGASAQTVRARVIRARELIRRQLESEPS